MYERVRMYLSVRVFHPLFTHSPVQSSGKLQIDASALGSGSDEWSDEASKGDVGP